MPLSGRELQAVSDKGHGDGHHHPVAHLRTALEKREKFMATCLGFRVYARDARSYAFLHKNEIRRFHRRTFDL